MALESHKSVKQDSEGKNIRFNAVLFSSAAGPLCNRELENRQLIHIQDPFAASPSSSTQ